MQRYFVEITLSNILKTLLVAQLNGACPFPFDESVTELLYRVCVKNENAGRIRWSMVIDNGNKRVFRNRNGKSESALINKWRRQVFERDGYKCTECGTNKNLHAHHLVSRKNEDLKYDVSNGITLCKSWPFKKTPRDCID